MEKEKKHGFSATTAMVIGVAVIYILLGLAKIMIPDFKPIHIVYIASFVLDIFGIILIVKYCLSGDYRDLGKYEFSIGVLCLLCGILMIVRVSTITKYFYLFIGICILLTSIIKLQNAVDLRGVEHGAWFVFLILSMVFVALAVVIILNPGSIVKKYDAYLYYLLIVDGAFQIFSTIFLAISLFIKKRKKDKPQDEFTDFEDESSAENKPSVPEKNTPDSAKESSEESVPAENLSEPSDNTDSSSEEE